MEKRYKTARALASRCRLCYAGKNGPKGCESMKIRILYFLLALLSLTACGAPAEEKTPASQTAEPAPVLETSRQPARNLRPYVDWVFEPDPYLVSGADYDALFSGTASGSPPETAPWFGVPALFPFTEMQEIGVCEGTFDWETNTCDEAWAIANRYYSMAIEYSAPDGTRCLRQESNYPQFCSEHLDRYRWGTFYGGAVLPEQPAPYEASITIQAAELNWICEDQLYADVNDWEACESLPLAEHTRYQNQWLTERSIEEQQWKADYAKEHGESSDWVHYDIPDNDRYYAATVLTIFNGDSRTEEAYFSGSRAKDIRITVNGEYFREVTLADSPAPQLISLDYTQHTIAKPLDITIEVLSAYPGERPDIYISEIGVGIDSNLPQGR